MVDTAFDDFLDSDDDALFIEASNQILDCYLVSESSQTTESNSSQKQSGITVSNFKFQTTKSDESQNNVFGASRVSQKECKDADQNVNTPAVSEEIHASNIPYSKTLVNVCDDNVKNAFAVNSSQKQPEITSDDFKLQFTTSEDENSVSDPNTISEEIHASNSSCSKMSSNICKDTVKKAFATTSAGCKSNKILDCNEVALTECETIKKDMTVGTTSVKQNTPGVFLGLNKTPESFSYINSRFTPGFTPKAKKRKLPGPAGLLELFDGSENTGSGSSHKVMTLDIEFENIVSSQYTPEHLSLPSWKKLQTAVSSCSNLHSTAKHYSIKRVLQESSKKKLPKHMVVPVLCVLLKKLNYKGSPAISVFMDDTGEINGKIDSDILSTYKEILVEGTALILKNVTFLCNVLILKSQNLVSMYHSDGTEKHPQTLESFLETSEPLKPMNCECLKLSRVKENTPKTSHYNATPNNHMPSCSTHSQKRFNNTSNQDTTLPKISQFNNTPKSYKSGCNSHNLSRINNHSNQNKAVSNINSKKVSSVTESASHSKGMRSNAFLENLLDEDNCMDEFDELLGNLDEKSFMDEI